MYMYLDFSGETVKDKKADKQQSYILQKTNKRQSMSVSKDSVEKLLISQNTSETDKDRLSDDSFHSDSSMEDDEGVAKKTGH